ncbi:MAG: hypothetical protein OXI53_11350 [Nitrospira sp.]|nr:hypothetical protein [Nitrospira sp.]MDE0505168.1 hypothetical protein [Candidatus Poribacteria bacterium]
MAQDGPPWRAPFRCELEEPREDPLSLEEIKREITALRQAVQDLTAILSKMIQDMPNPERRSVLRYIEDNLLYETEQDLEVTRGLERERFLVGRRKFLKWIIAKLG